MQFWHAFTPARIGILLFTLTYVIGFYTWFIIRGNTEFIFYIAQFVFFISFACWLIARSPDFPTYLLGLISLIGLMHVIGGGVDLGATRLYDLHLVTLYDGGEPGFYILKYDQLVHILGFGIAALVARYIIKRDAPLLSLQTRSVLVVLVAAGLGAINEISEFAAKVFLARTGVGGYYNLALDLTVNLLGALIAVVIVESIDRLKKNQK